MKTAIYARVSTLDQNPELQIHELRNYAHKRNLEIVKEYVDQSSGVAERRPKHAEYHALLKDAYARRFDCVLVWKFDRFARSVSALLNALQTFNSLGISFISMTQQIDTTTPMGRLFFAIVGSFSEFEREMIVERTRAGVANARRKGNFAGPKRDLILEVRVKKLRAKGTSIGKIAKLVKRSPAGVFLILNRSTANDKPQQKSNASPEGQ